MVTYGPDEGKLCVIVDVVDQTRVSVEHVVYLYVRLFYISLCYETLRI